MDNFVTLYNRLLSRCPGIGPILAQQFINDSWRTLQSYNQDWSWRTRTGCFAPPNLYQTGTATTNVANGAPTLITGTGTAWTADMIGRQIRIGGLLYPYYTIVGWLSPTQILIDQPWYGPDVTTQPYQILQIYFPVPADFGYFLYVVSVKDAYRLWTNEVTQFELAVADPQRTNQGQTYACVFRDYTSQFGGVIGPVIPVAATGPAPISTTSTGYTYVANATYIVQVVLGGISGTATFQWMRSGQTAFQPAALTSDQEQDLMDGVQIYWPDNVPYITNDLFIINAQSLVTQSGPRYELWPGPTFNGYLYPYQYMAKEYDLTPEQPQLPPFIANRGEVILEMALEKCATFPGTDSDHPNPYFNLTLSRLHESRKLDMIYDLERNDQNVSVSRVDYKAWPMAPAPWMDGAWQQTHAPFLA